MIALDTNIAIAYLVGETQVREHLRLAVLDGDKVIISTIAEHAAKIRRQTKIKLTDSAIAATALTHEASLATRDQQFKKVPGLTILEW